jgi:hypothetical protein
VAGAARTCQEGDGVREEKSARSAAKKSSLNPFLEKAPRKPRFLKIALFAGRSPRMLSGLAPGRARRALERLTQCRAGPAFFLCGLARLRTRGLAASQPTLRGFLTVSRLQLQRSA